MVQGKKKTPQRGQDMISKGKVRIICSGYGIKLYWNDAEVTQGVGLNSAINTLGSWTDSSKAKWEVLAKGIDYFRLRVRFLDLPITQIWDLKIRNRQEIHWQISMNLKEDLYIDERRVACLVSPSYKTWVNGYQQGDFPSTSMWQDIALNNLFSRFVGVKSSIEGIFLPSLGLEFSDSAHTQTFPLIQNTSKEINARIISAKMFDTEENKHYLPGKYRFFSGKIILFENDDYLRIRRGYREGIKRFFIYPWAQGIRCGFRRMIIYLFVRKKVYVRIGTELSKGPVALFRMRVKSIYKLMHKKINSKGFIPTFREIKNNYLDIVGVFSKRIALKGPNFAQVDLTNKCNNNCIACWCNSSLLKEKRNNEQSLAYEKVIALIDTFKKMGTKEIYLAGGGEPFMHPQILEVIRHIKKKGFICSLNTNFTLIDEKIISELVKLKVDYLIVSLWAGSPSTYKITHPNKDEITFYKIEQMLKLLARVKERYPRVCITNVISNLNWQDIENMTTFALEVKADAINFAVIDVIPGMTDRLLLNKTQQCEVLEKIKRIMDNKKIKERIDFWGIKKFINRLSNPFSSQGDYDKGLIENIPCYAGWLFSRILANGDVNACLKAHRIPVGNIYIDNFQKIWNSQKQQEFRNRTCVNGRKDPFFTYIGNNPETKEAGCYRSCDDFERIVSMDRQIESLVPLEETLCNWVAGFFSLF